MPRVLFSRLNPASLHREASKGFALPVALGASLLVLLSSSSLQLLALRERAEMAQLQQRQQLEDVLASAAQQQVATMQAANGCLLPVPIYQWPLVGKACGVLPEHQQQLLAGQVTGRPYRVTNYRLLNTTEVSALAELELRLDADRPWKSLYRITLKHSGERWQVAAIQDLGLRGAGS